ncbi:hypothetical protein NUW54_g7189 [Trametes sanguinea]|uniref:Uncharacterized protein n=1 Tax=Trametes sanguinea TaxID=158606 RepID=A0ACC1PPT6_9APHY|nr:hypothetical protein NUW54_g7189 [Trametes sanguinea]
MLLTAPSLRPLTPQDGTWNWLETPVARPMIHSQSCLSRSPSMARRVSAPREEDARRRVGCETPWAGPARHRRGGQLRERAAAGGERARGERVNAGLPCGIVRADSRMGGAQDLAL